MMSLIAVAKATACTYHTVDHHGSKWSTVAICKHIEWGAQDASTLSKECTLTSLTLNYQWARLSDSYFKHTSSLHTMNMQNVTLQSYQSTHTTHKLSWQAEADGYTWAAESIRIYGPSIATILQVAIVLLLYSGCQPAISLNFLSRRGSSYTTWVVFKARIWSVLLKPCGISTYLG